MIKRFLLLSLLLLSGGAFAAVTTIGTSTSDTGTSTTPSVAYTVASGTDVAYICIFANAGATINSINNFGGVAPQLVGSQASALYLYRVINPAAGATTAQATISSSEIWSIHVMGLDGVDTADPDDTPVTNTNNEQTEITATVTSAVGDMAIACGLLVSDTIAASSGATLSTEEESLGGGFISTAFVYEAGAASVTLGVNTTATFSDNQIISTNVNASGGAPASGLLRRRRGN